MHQLEARLRQVLEHVNTDRWQRPAALLLLIAREAGPWWIELGPKAIQELAGRTPRQARDDHVTLVEMAAAKVLLRWASPGGRRGDVWQINPRLRDWHVDWITPREAVLRDLGRDLWTPARQLWPLTPGQSVALRTLGATPEGPPKKLTRAFPPPQLSSTVIHMATNDSPPGETDPPGVRKRQPSCGPLPSSLTSENHSLPYPPNGPREGGREEQAREGSDEAHERLAKRLQEVLSPESIQRFGRPVEVRPGTSMEARVWRLAQSYDGDPTILLRRCDRFAGTFSLTRACDDLEEWIRNGCPPDTASLPTRNLAAIRANLEREIEYYTQAGDEPLVDELRDQLAQLLADSAP